MQTVIAEDIDGNRIEVPLKDLQWRPSVYGVVIVDKKLLVSPQHHEGSYDLPGGGIGMDEHIEQALIREVKEETGIDVEVGQLLAASDNYFKITWREPHEARHTVKLYYYCTMQGGSISTGGFDNKEKAYIRPAQWLPISQLETISFLGQFDWRYLVRELASN